MKNYGNETQKFFRLTLNRENFVPQKFPNIRYIDVCVCVCAGQLHKQ